MFILEFSCIHEFYIIAHIFKILLSCPILVYLTAYLQCTWLYEGKTTFTYIYIPTNMLSIFNSSACVVVVLKVNFNNNKKNRSLKNLQYKSLISILLSFIKIFPLEKLSSKVLSSLWCSQTLIFLPLCPELGSFVQCYVIRLSLL